MSNLATELGHLKTHVQYPASRADVIATCGKMHDMPNEDAQWFEASLPEGTYGNANEVLAALLTKV